VARVLPWVVKYLLVEVTDCYRWRGDDGVNDRPVGKPEEEGMMNIAASFSLGKKPRFVDPVGKSQYS
jgi:hypothetical protein